MLAVSSGRRQIPADPPAGQLEELGDDPRAALSLVQLGEFEDRRPDRLVARPGEAVEQLPLERRQPAQSAGSQSRVPRTRPTGRSASRLDRRRSVLGGRGSHEPAPSCLMISSAL